MKVKLLSLYGDFSYDYYNDSYSGLFGMLASGFDSVDLETEDDFLDLQNAIMYFNGKHKHKTPKVELILIRDSSSNEEVKSIMDDYKSYMVKEQKRIADEEKKREEADRLRVEKASKKSLERKRKQLEKLKKELGE